MNHAQKKALILAIVGLIFAGIISGCGRAAVAKVNGHKITRQDYYNRLERTLIDTPNGQQEVGLLVLRDLINEQLLLGLAEKEHVPPTDKQVEERYNHAKKQPFFMNRLRAAGVTQEQARDLLRVQQAHFNLVTRGVKVTDKEVREYYEKHKDTIYTQPEYALVAAIFTDDKKTADEAYALLQKGVDFGTVALQKSTDRVSAAVGGRLRKAIVRGDPELPKEVQDAVLSKKKGEYTKPIFGGNGYVIFKVLEKKPKQVQPFEQVKYGIWNQLMIERGSKKNDLEAMLNKFREESDIKINIERYRRFLQPPKAQPIPGQQTPNPAAQKK
ncbi:MAG: peptidyl-prolyl cis-trans isomerase [Armatimonadota bacterium]|nr:peptidyl-prolyl cis-trans isomerase [Armatimonadota bacterium]